MKKLSLALVLVLIVSLFAGTALADWTPSQPILIMNHVAVGGAMDMYTRQWKEIAKKYAPDVTFNVD
ncbi:MAG: tripartite tricarboxylate transporter substrate binding protein, partial [Clostridia bacterium]|nr:tripartite tricarboxylate transporter substrate binding protein [Clostridia bacterium]